MAVEFCFSVEITGKEFAFNHKKFKKNIKLIFFNSSKGLVFALIELVGGLMTFAGKPLIDEVSKNGLTVYYYTMLGSAIALLTINMIQVPLMFEFGDCLIRFD